MILSQQSLYRSKPLHEQTYLVLRSAILSGEIAVGERLIETQLSENLKISRTPVREAIRRLQQEGLVKADSDGWLYVVKLSLADAIKLYNCRIALEQVSVVGACENATVQQLEELEQVLTEAETIANQNTDYSNSIQLLELNCRFHQLLAESSGNPWVVSLLNQISNQITLLRVQTLKEHLAITEIHAEHRYIYNAVTQRDPEAAIQHITNHLSFSQKRIIQIFSQMNQTLSPQELGEITCPRCRSTEVSKNGRRSGKQNYICKDCGRQFLDSTPSSRLSS